MNKISKKIVALATMAAFVLTLVPAAAFAAPADDNNGIIIEQRAVDSVNVDFAGISQDLTKVKINVTDADGDAVVVDLRSQDGSPLTDPAAVGKTSTTEIATVNSGYDYRIPLDAGSYDIDVVANGTTVASVDDFIVYGRAVADASQYGVFKGNELQSEATVSVGTDLTTTFKINDLNGDATSEALDDVVIWAENVANGQVTELAKVTAVKGATVAGTTGDKGYILNDVENNAEVKVQFSVAGDYKLFAGVDTNAAPKVSVAKDNKLDSAYTTVKVTDDTVVDSFKVSASIDGAAPEVLKFDETNTAVLKLYENDDFRYDGIDKIELIGEALEADKTPAKNQTINFDTTRTDVVEFSKTTDNTDNDGEFGTTFTMQDKKNAIITITDEATGLEYTIRVIAATTTAQDINRTLTGGYVLAGTDSNWTDYNRLFTDAVQFEVLNDKGEMVTGQAAVEGRVIEVKGQPDGANLTGDNFDLVDSGNGVYTLYYTGNPKNLIPGEYTVRVALASEDNATVTFTAAKFGKAQDTVLDVYAADHDWTWGNPNEEIMTVDDQITLGQYVGVVAKYVDENGIKIAAKDVSYGFNGKAVVDPMPKDGTFSTPANVPANESLLGTEVEIVAFNTAKNQLVTKTLTVVDAYSDKSLEFDPVQGPTNEDNKVTVSVVNEDGKVQQVEGTLDAWVVDQSNEDAKISVDAKDGRHAVQNGKGTLTVYSDQETTADIVVVVKAGSEAYYGTLEYTFGTEDPLADRTVVMTIDSTEYVVNNNIITGDAAPYVDSAWRTMVPIRALAEAFDAEVIWNQDDSTVTINFDAGTEIVMTVGEETYTVNGAEATMDTEPVNAGDRVYVPIRFAAEGLGFSVTPLYNDAGLTASVVFQR